MPAADVPHGLRRIAGFTPAKRAKLGGPALLAELAGSTAFRAAVVAWWDEHRPGELTADEPADLLTAAAAAVLTGDAGAAAAVAATAKRAEVGEVKAERDTLLSKVDKLTTELERLRGELTEARAQAREAGQQREAEFLQLRRRLSEQGATLRAALDARARGRGADGARCAPRPTKRLAAADADLRAGARPRRGRAQARRPGGHGGRRGPTGRTGGPAGRRDAPVAPGRHARRRRRRAAPRAGARRRRPAPRRPRARARGASPVGHPIDSVAGLDALLAVPTLHLVVDGYNVSKTGYPELTLADQRNRLITQLGALAARTRVEITVVFDGAGVMAAPPRGARGVRVLFSDPGVLADDVIRSIVAAEPHGRPVAVATADRAVVTSIRASGAYSVPSSVLVTRLARP